MRHLIESTAESSGRNCSKERKWPGRDARAVASPRQGVREAVEEQKIPTGRTATSPSLPNATPSSAARRLASSMPRHPSTVSMANYTVRYTRIKKPEQESQGTNPLFSFSSSTSSLVIRAALSSLNYSPFPRFLFLFIAPRPFHLDPVAPPSGGPVLNVPSRFNVETLKGWKTRAPTAQRAVVIGTWSR